MIKLIDILNELKIIPDIPKLTARRDKTYNDIIYIKDLMIYNVFSDFTITKDKKGNDIVINKEIWPDDYKEKIKNYLTEKGIKFKLLYRLGLYYLIIPLEYIEIEENINELKIIDNVPKLTARMLPSGNYYIDYLPNTTWYDTKENPHYPKKLQNHFKSIFHNQEDLNYTIKKLNNIHIPYILDNNYLYINKEYIEIE